MVDKEQKSNILTSTLFFTSAEKIHPSVAEKLRGHFANLYREENLYHNHLDDGRDIYRYPLIQYKVINGKFTVLGMNAGAKLVKQDFLKHNSFVLNEKTYTIVSTEIDLRKQAFTVTDRVYRYRFKTIWAPLNSKNHILYRQGRLDLNRALQNNLLSDLKGLGIRADKRIIVNNSRFEERSFKHKNKLMTGFIGSFECNMEIPQWIGTGKWKSVGFGVIERENFK